MIMRKQGRGFTVVELVITVAIMVILTTLVVTRLLLTESGGRDKEREIDMTTIATGLEVYYDNGSPDGSISKGHYPGSEEVDAAAAVSPPFNTFLDGVPIESYEAPDDTTNDTDFDYSIFAGSNPDGSYSDAEAKSHLEYVPYLYQPLTRSNAHCFSYVDCVKFNLYYMKEDGDSVQKIRSKHQ